MPVNITEYEHRRQDTIGHELPTYPEGNYDGETPRVLATDVAVGGTLTFQTTTNIVRIVGTEPFRYRVSNAVSPTVNDDGTYMPAGVVDSFFVKPGDNFKIVTIAG